MPTTPAQKDQIVSCLEPLGDVTARPMMGEYLVYFNGTYFANICDGHLLVKITPTNSHYDLPEVLPYASAKRNMLRVDDLDNLDFLQELITETLKGLPSPNRRKNQPRNPTIAISTVARPAPHISQTISSLGSPKTAHMIASPTHKISKQIAVHGYRICSSKLFIKLFFFMRIFSPSLS